MPMPRRTTVFSFLGFAAVLCLAIIFRPQNVSFLETKTFTDFDDEGYGDVIGIELGRTYSRVGVMRHNIFEIIVDEQGHSAIPSYVAFTNRGRSLVGFAAKDQAVSNPKNTIYDVRRLMGRNFSDPELQDDIRDLLYDVVEKDGRLSIKVQINGADTYFTLEEISAKVLEKLKNMAEAHLNRAVKFAVITVPSHFNGTQREATRDAALIAGLNTLRVVNEPTAAGIAYRIDRIDFPWHEAVSNECDDCNFLIYNLGEKESDMVLESVDHGVFEVLAMAGDKSLGGYNFESPLLNHAIVQLNKENNIDITKDFEAVGALKFEVDKVEQALSTGSAKIDIPAHPNFNRFSMTITQTQLLELNRQLSDRALGLVKELLEDAKLEKRDVNGIILTGNPSHIAKVQPFIEAYFDGKKVHSDEGINPDHAIVRGAAIQGQVLSSYESDDGCGLLMDVNRLSMGIETSGGIFTKLIPRYTVIPTRNTRDFLTVADNQEKIVINVLEGERAIACKNRVIGTLELTGLPLKPRGAVEIEVTFEMDANENLAVTAREKESGKEAKLVVTASADRYTWEEVDTIVLEADTHYEEDELLVKELSFPVQDGGKNHRFGVTAK